MSTRRYAAAGPLTLKTHLADRPNTHKVVRGEISSPLVKLDVCGPASVPQGFKPLVRDNAFEASELSLMTYLQAKAYGKPLVLLPATVLGRFQHVFLTVPSGSPIYEPKQLEGLRVGIRSYTVTTVAWTRAILQAQFGVDIGSITWVAYEDSHVAEFSDPPNVERIDMNGRNLEDLLIEGVVDAAVLGQPAKGPELRPLFAEPERAAQDWYDRFGTIQVNHMFVVNTILSAERPDVVEEIYRMLKLAADAAPVAELGINALPFGVDTNRRNLEVAIDCAFQQRLIPRRFNVDELFDETTIKLN
jgi:4,5-dihydroxyphthalate decarboxylase